MTIAKKISPVEFRLSLKSFTVDYSPANYFEKFRLEIIIQKLVHWIFWKYGLYLYIQRIQIHDNQILFQIYFYPTYFQARFIEKYLEKFDTTAAFEAVNLEEEAFAALNPVIWARICRVQKISSRKHNKKLATYKKRKMTWNKRLRFTKRYYLQESGQLTFVQYKKIWRIIVAKRRRNKFMRIRKQVPQIAFNFYFTYLFQHYFKLQSVILHKNLIKWFISNKAIKKEHRKLLHTTKYLQRYEWSFDMYFFTHIILVYSNPNFLLHIIYRLIAQSAVHKKIFYNFADILKKFYILKKHTVKGMKIALQGVYDRHGRTKSWVWEVGDISYTPHRSLILSDWITYWTRYGSFSVKLWIAYHDREVQPYVVKIDR